MSEDIAKLQHPRFSRMYLRISEQAERRGSTGHRQRMLSDLIGTVIEIGAGNGLNFAYYPATVTNVVAVEPDDTLRRSAERAATAAPIPITVVSGQADALPGPDGSYDGAVTSLVLCSVPDPSHALAEAARVLKPGGQLRFYEHVRSASSLLGRLQDVVAPAWATFGGGCHPNRDTLAAIERAGFEIDEFDRFSFRFSSVLPPIAHVVGRAHKIV